MMTCRLPNPIHRSQRPARGSFVHGVRVALTMLLVIVAGSAPALADSSPRVFARLFVEPPAIEPVATAAPLTEGRAPLTRWTAFGQDPQPAEQPPPPPAEGTGIGGFVKGTASDLVAFPRRRSTWVILAIGAGAAGLVHPIDDDLNARMVGSDFVSDVFAPGKWIGNPFVQLGSAAGVWVAGRFILPRVKGLSPDNKVSHLGLDLLRAVAVSQAFTHAIKITAQRDRPTGKCCSFPSGHAATTFATASVIERHLGYRAALPTLLVASYVSASRLHDNVHYASDVVFGAALGIATGWTVVGRHGRSNFTMMPLPIRGGAMIAFVRNGRGDDERHRTARRAGAP
jgi:membrane-associated phospholipid phosphatase